MVKKVLQNICFRDMQIRAIWPLEQAKLDLNKVNYQLELFLGQLANPGHGNSSTFRQALLLSTQYRKT